MSNLNEILVNWNIERPYIISEVNITVKLENREPNAWNINGSYILKKFLNEDNAKRSTEITKVLAMEGVPVAVPVKTKDGEDFLIFDDKYYCLYPKLTGKGLDDQFGGDYLGRANYLGQIIGDLHKAFIKCESLIKYRDINLFKHVSDWALPKVLEFDENSGVKIHDNLINEYKREFAEIYSNLPCQIIHRDMHGENMLFENGRLTGYIDFDLSQKNVRIFDPCYMSTSILSGYIDDGEKREKWIGIFKNILKGYDVVSNLSKAEKKAIPYVLYSVELIFIAYFSNKGYQKLAETNIRILNWIYENKNRLEYQ